jgi:signal transduction histidine kinase
MLVKTSTEILAFNPDSVLSYRYPTPSLVLTGFSIENRPVVVGSADSILPRAVNFMEKITLNYAQNKFTIQYAAVDFYGNVQYAYRLSGFEDNWQYVKNRTEAIYTNVPPGTYVFEVKVANHQGYWSASRILTVTVRSPWYRTWLAYILYTILAVSAVLWFIQYRSRHLKKENIRLEEKVNKRTNELTESLKELKETQQQLIQSEKMASLGELTAGIAHEIQNPLNFVNNFSEVNEELLQELKSEAESGNLDEVKAIADDLIQNEQKIHYHGKRADAIVKSMLQHSRSTSGAKEAADISALCDEYVRLAYHGFRAKDNSFNAAYSTNFDDSIGLVNVMPQELGRVLLNLINNAFYAVAEKSKTAGPDFQPAVSIATRKIDNQVEITVSDNGNGIPEAIRKKIFQPFFTTKPTGQGTGLGLSLSYDIVKAHGGELKVETKEKEGTAFTIILPSNQT